MTRRFADPVAFAFSDAASFALIARRRTRTNRLTSAGAAQMMNTIRARAGLAQRSVADSGRNEGPR